MKILNGSKIMKTLQNVYFSIKTDSFGSMVKTNTWGLK
jgi:hypothetical protein